MSDDLTFQDNLLNDSRLAPTGSGNSEDPPSNTPPTSGQKWTAALLAALLAGIVFSPPAFLLTSKVTTSLGGIPTTDGVGGNASVNIVGLLLHVLILTLVFRIILW